MEPRQIVTLSGPVEYERPVFHCPSCRASLAPLDSEMGAEKGCHFTRRVKRAVTHAAATGSFGDASQAMRENFALEISAAQVCVIAGEEGERIAALSEKREEQWRSGARPAEHKAEVAVILSDGAAVLTRSGEEHKMVNLVRGFGLDARVTEEGQRPMLTYSRYSGTAKEEACAGGAASDLAARILAVGCRIGADQAKRVVFIADGNPTLWYICEELYPEAVCIQDFWHVMEYLGAAASAVTKSGEAAAELRERWADALKDSQVDGVKAQLEEKRRKVRSPAKRETLRKAIEYLEAGRERMDYAAYAQEGFPIGSGSIEAACKHVVKERFNLTGARWSREKTGNMLALRLAIANEEWQLYWQPLPADQLEAA